MPFGLPARLLAIPAAVLLAACVGTPAPPAATVPTAPPAALLAPAEPPAPGPTEPPTAVPPSPTPTPPVPTPTPAGVYPAHPFEPAAGRPRVVALDPGHGGAEIGAAGGGLLEKDVNLRIALKLRDRLTADGLQVVLTRDSDRRARELPVGQAPAGYSVTRVDLQGRIDIANEAGADVFLSIHNNGAGDTR